jgi:hypothetical protein
MTFSDLHDAFAELERRADASEDLVGAPAARRSRRRSAARPVQILISAAAVTAIAVGIGFAAGGFTHHVAGAQSPGSATASVRTATGQTAALSASSPNATAPAATPPPTDVPRTQTELIARFRSILGDTAAFTVDPVHSSDDLITGVLTSAAGTRGMYVLEIDKDAALCGGVIKPGEQPTPVPCPHVTTLADGSQLKVDPNFPDGPPNGVMDDAILSRPDGWQISLYTANVQGKYYGAPVLGSQPALTVEQVKDVVTSPAWLAK